MATTNKKVSDSMLIGVDGLDASMFGDFSDVQEERPNLSTIPLLKMIQGISPELRDRKTYPGIYAGCLVNSDTKQIIGGDREDHDHVLKAYVLLAYNSRTKFPPRNSGVQIPECSALMKGNRGQDDWGTKYGQCKFCQYSAWGVKDRCGEQFNMIICLADDISTRLRIIMHGASFKQGKAFKDAWKETVEPIRAKLGKYPPLYVLPVYIYTKEVTNKANDVYSVWDIDVRPFEPVSRETMAALKEAKESVQILYEATVEMMDGQANAIKSFKTSTDEPKGTDNKEEAYNAIEDAFGGSSGPAYEDGELPF